MNLKTAHKTLLAMMGMTFIALLFTIIASHKHGSASDESRNVIFAVSFQVWLCATVIVAVLLRKEL